MIECWSSPRWRPSWRCRRWSAASLPDRSSGTRTWSSGMRSSRPAPSPWWPCRRSWTRDWRGSLKTGGNFCQDGATTFDQLVKCRPSRSGATPFGRLVTFVDPAVLFGRMHSAPNKRLSKIFEEFFLLIMDKFNLVCSDLSSQAYLCGKTASRDCLMTPV